MDFYRFGLRATGSFSEPENTELEALIEAQADRFKVLYGTISAFDYDHIEDDEAQRTQRILEKEVLAKEYAKVSADLRAFFDFPAWNISTGVAKDISYLLPCFPIRAIFDNPTFPPCWRIEACRSYLPPELEKRLLVWKQWSQEVADGQHLDYLKRLHAYDTSKIVWKHWDDLQFRVSATKTMDKIWVYNPKLVRLRNKILALPEPKILPMPKHPDEQRDGLAEEEYQAVFKDVAFYFDMSKRWNGVSKGFSKCHYSAGHYKLDFNAFKAEAYNASMQDFLQWADKCVLHHFGLFLDY